MSLDITALATTEVMASSYHPLPRLALLLAVNVQFE